MLTWIIENPSEFVSIVVTIISTLGGAYVAIRSGKFSKAKDFMEQAIKEAEKLPGIAGLVKKEIVMSKIRGFCSKIRLKFNEDMWSKLIDTCVDLMNSNARINKEQG